MLSSLFSGRSLPPLNLSVSTLVPIRLLPISVQKEAELLLEFTILQIMDSTFRLISVKKDAGRAESFLKLTIFLHIVFVTFSANKNDSWIKFVH